MSEPATTKSAEDCERELLTELRPVDFLHDLPDEEMRISLRGVLLKFGAGEIIVREGDVGDSLYLVRSGEVEVITRGNDTQEVHISNLKPPAFFGEMGVDDGQVTQRYRPGTY
jgi:CRP-like cAMP-binding protein